MKVAVIGGGIAGISSAWHLDRRGIDVHLIEAGLRTGGHTHTHALQVQEGVVNVDTGFIVFNEHNYPNFSAWLRELGVHAARSDMSFAVCDDILGLEYGTGDARAMTAHPTQLVRPGYWRLWRDLFRFYRTLRAGPVDDITLGEYLDQHGYSGEFVHSHIAPMCAALWSQPARESLNLSLPHVVTFMRNHSLLQVAQRPAWQVVAGGSSSYLRAFEAEFGGRVHTNGGDARVSRQRGAVTVEYGGRTDMFDAVVVACHSDQALAALTDATPAERAVLGAIPYQRNDVYLHSDVRFMPRKPSCWSSWNVIRERDGEYTITYWMNRLQGLTCREQFFVTLNPGRAPEKVRWQGTYEHPHYTRASFDAQSRWAEISRGQTFFAGAYWGAGFHEDGFVSGIRCADAIAPLVAADVA